MLRMADPRHCVTSSLQRLDSRGTKSASIYYIILPFQRLYRLIKVRQKVSSEVVWKFSEQSYGIFTPNFTHLLLVHMCLKFTRAIWYSLTVAKLWNFFRDNNVTLYIQKLSMDMLAEDTLSNHSDWQIVYYVVQMTMFYCSAHVMQTSLYTNVRNDYAVTE